MKKIAKLLLFMVLSMLLLYSCKNNEEVSTANETLNTSIKTSESVDNTEPTTIGKMTDTENEETTQESVTESCEITSTQTIPQKISNDFVSSKNAKLLCFSGCFDDDSPCNKFQTLDSDSINNFINELNKIKYTSYKKSTSGGNWAEGYWEVMIYKDGVLCYDIHTERDIMYITDRLNSDELNGTILKINDDIRHEFEKKVFDFNNDVWEEYVNSNEEYWKEIKKIDTYAGLYYDNVLVAGNDFTKYKEIENKYTKYHDFRKPYYKTVKYSRNELEQSSNIISEKGKDYSVFNVNINVKNNLIEVYMTEDNEDYKNAITELSPIKDLKFIVSNEYLPQENPKT